MSSRTQSVLRFRALHISIVDISKYVRYALQRVKLMLRSAGKSRWQISKCSLITSHTVVVWPCAHLLWLVSLAVATPLAGLCFKHTLGLLLHS